MAIMRRLFRAVLLVLVGLEAVYLFAANAVLGVPLLRDRILNRRPDRFHIAWNLGLTPWPGLVHLRGVRTGGRSHALEWAACVETVTARFTLLPLRRREVHLSRVEASGIAYAQRPRLQPGEAAPEEVSEWPSIEGLAAPRPGPADRDDDAGPERRERPAWRVRADRIDAGVTRIWIGRYRIDCRAHVRATMDLRVRGDLTLSRIDYDQDDGTLRIGEERFFEGFRLRTRARLEAFRPRGRKAVDVLRALSGDFEMDAREASLRFLQAYLRHAPDLRLNGGGPMSFLLRLDHGRLLPGSRLRRERDRIDVTFLDHRLVGEGTITAEVAVVDGVPRSRLEATMDHHEITQPGEDHPFAFGHGFRVVATSTNLDLLDPFTDVTVDVDLPQARVPDLSVYNHYLPRTDRFAIVSGAGTLSYHFTGDSNEKSWRGALRLDMRALVFRFETTTLRGDVRIDTRLREGLPRERRFDISGTRIVLRHRDPPWRGTISFPHAALRFTQPLWVRARVALDLQDTRPLVRLFDAHHDVSHLVERLMTIADVKGGALFRMDAQAVDLADLALEGRGLRALAEMRLAPRRTGILYVRLHGISVGVDLEPGKKPDLDLFRPRAWYDDARSRFWRRRPHGEAPPSP